jgi:hypothetical protein
MFFDEAPETFNPHVESKDGISAKYGNDREYVDLWEFER